MGKVHVQGYGREGGGHNGARLIRRMVLGEGLDEAAPCLGKEASKGHGPRRNRSEEPRPQALDLGRRGRRNGRGHPPRGFHGIEAPSRPPPSSGGLRPCRGRPPVLVDRGPWYSWALNALRPPYGQAHGGRNRVEALFSSPKAHTRRFNDNVNSKGVEEGLECWSIFLRGFQLWRDIA